LQICRGEENRSVHLTTVVATNLMVVATRRLVEQQSFGLRK
jgi:hypothetical protein